MKFLNQFWVFYKKLIIPSAIVSIVIALIGMGNINIIAASGTVFIFITPFFHFIFYDLSNPKEYYFYYNVGLSRWMLWVGTIVFSLIIGGVLALI